MKTISYQCISKQTNTQLKDGKIPVYGKDLFEAYKQLNVIMAQHMEQGNRIVYRNRHSMKVEVQEDE
jgi:hypothetical protein